MKRVQQTVYRGKVFGRREIDGMSTDGAYPNVVFRKRCLLLATFLEYGGVLVQHLLECAVCEALLVHQERAGPAYAGDLGFKNPKTL